MRTTPNRQMDVARSGAVMLEFVVVFPIVLVLVFGCIQFAQIWTARMVVHYAAFCAARAALVCEESQYPTVPLQAARQVCLLVNVDPDPAAVGAEVRATPKWNVTAVVSNKFSLITPIVGPILAWGMNPWDQAVRWTTPLKSEANTDSLGYPTITLTESVTLPKPYKTMSPGQF